ncbi:MAG: glycosyltransferase family 25 protein [Terricaulis sp.]
MTPNIIVVNLDADVERMAHMRGQLDKTGLAYERFSAICGANVPARLQSYFAKDSLLSPGEIGCYASHLAVFQRVVASRLASPLLVLEDDVALPHDLPEQLNALLHALPERWDIVRLSSPTKRLTRPLANLRGGYELVRYSNVPASTGAYLINISGARKLLELRPRSLPIDQDLRRVWAWDLDTYGVAPPLIRPDVLGSSSIDEMSPIGRACIRRGGDMRTQRLREGIARFRRGVRDFGLPRWLAVEALGVAARLTPRRTRAAFYEWAKACVA